VKLERLTKVIKFLLVLSSTVGNLRKLRNMRKYEILEIHCIFLISAHFWLNYQILGAMRRKAIVITLTLFRAEKPATLGWGLILSHVYSINVFLMFCFCANSQKAYQW
jgi:hypothetical protein